ncbi:MAG TPA: N-formylglutamate amidohydrolase [Stellaceae bacterium]|nr:N-formylglutamate amidohydrolase [Stellaceae bacterium]
MPSSSPLPASLLCAGDPPPVEICHGAGQAPVILTCDHASCAIPRALGGLGLPPGAVREHIGWDIGAAAVTRRLAVALDARAVLSGYSRLVVDCNRDIEDSSSIPEISDGVAVPGNQGLLPEARVSRIDTFFAPYHTAIAVRLDAMLSSGVVPALISIHSFTPVMNGFERPWHIGVLWDRDPRLPVPLLAALRAELGDAVGDNQPYSAREPAGYTVRHHAVTRGLPHVALELRQDLIATDEGAASWAQRLVGVLRPLLSRPDIYRVERV